MFRIFDILCSAQAWHQMDSQQCELTLDPDGPVDVDSHYTQCYSFHINTSITGVPKGEF